MTLTFAFFYWSIVHHMRTLGLINTNGIDFGEINLFGSLFLRENSGRTSTSWFWSSIRGVIEYFGSHPWFEWARTCRLPGRIIFDDIRTLLKYLLLGFGDRSRSWSSVFYIVIDPDIDMLLQVRSWDIPPIRWQFIDVGLIGLFFLGDDFFSSSTSHHIFNIDRRHRNDPRFFCPLIIFFFPLAGLVAKINIQLFFQDVKPISFR